jgi:hypothetical protein
VLKKMVEDRRQMRRAVMAEMYDLLGGRMHSAITGAQLAEHMGLDPEEVYAALDFLEGERLLDTSGLAGYGLSHKGIKEIEAAKEHPERATEHFPAIQVINNYGGNQVVAQGRDIHVSQLNLTQLSEALRGLAEQLTSADGGILSQESETLLRTAQSGATPIKIASAAEDVAAKSEKHASILVTFREELTKKLAEKTAEGALHGAEWLCQQGPQFLAALALAIPHH